jgi:5-methylcytosine-specific restriction protein A
MAKLDWTRGETILASDLYFRLRDPGIFKSYGEIEELSIYLRTLPIYPIADRPDNFRDHAGVAMKMSNFQSIDPSYTSGGRRGLIQRNRIAKLFGMTL